MIRPKDKLWFLDNKLGKISCVTVEKVRKQDFSFRSKGNLYRANFASIGTKYFSSQKDLMNHLKQRAEQREER